MYPCYKKNHIKRKQQDDNKERLTFFYYQSSCYAAFRGAWKSEVLNNKGVLLAQIMVQLTALQALYKAAVSLASLCSVMFHSF